MKRRRSQTKSTKNPAVVSYDDETHSYTVDGKRVPSVTEVTSILTAGKYADSNAAMLAQAQRRGTEVHDLCLAIDCGVPPDELDIPPELVCYINAYLAFLRDWSPEWDYMEKMVWTEHYAGRADRIGRIDGKSVIVDIKTAGNMDRLSKLALYFQLCGYADAWRSMGNGAPDRTLGVQLKRDGKYTIHRSEDTVKKYFPEAKRPFASLIFWDLLEITRMIGGYQ